MANEQVHIKHNEWTKKRNEYLSLSSSAEWTERSNGSTYIVCRDFHFKRKKNTLDKHCFRHLSIYWKEIGGNHWKKPNCCFHALCFFISIFFFFFSCPIDLRIFNLSWAQPFSLSLFVVLLITEEEEEKKIHWKAAKGCIEFYTCAMKSCNEW